MAWIRTLKIPNWIKRLLCEHTYGRKILIHERYSNLNVWHVYEKMCVKCSQIESEVICTPRKSN